MLVEAEVSDDVLVMWMNSDTRAHELGKLDSKVN